MKNKLLIFSLILITPFVVHSQQNKRNRNIIDFPVLTIGPSFGGGILFYNNPIRAVNIQFKYKAGGFIVFRPIEKLGIEAEYCYGKWVDGYTFHEVPILLQMYYNNNSAFKFGPLLYYSGKDDTFHNNQLFIGLKVGIGNQFGGTYLEFTKGNSSVKTFYSTYLCTIGLSLKLSLLKI